jgi:phage terminase Nu1 subunit (DNA packaging protein)
MEETLKLEQLISEKELAKALGVSRNSLRGYRQKGLPWVSMGGRPFYHEPTFMKWILQNQRRVAESPIINKPTSE